MLPRASILPEMFHHSRKPLQNSHTLGAAPLKRVAGVRGVYEPRAIDVSQHPPALKGTVAGQRSERLRLQ